jgi:hypothetical protein
MCVSVNMLLIIVSFQVSVFLMIMILIILFLIILILITLSLMNLIPSWWTAGLTLLSIRYWQLHMLDSDTGVITLGNWPIGISLSGLKAVFKSCRSINLVSTESVRVRKEL